MGTTEMGIYSVLGVRHACNNIRVLTPSSLIK